MKKSLAILSIVFLSFGVVQNSTATVVGNDVINRALVDSASNINFIDRNLIFAHDGFVESWDIYAGRSASEFALQVFRSTGSPNQYTLIGENYFAGAGALGVRHFAIAAADQIEVMAGDVVGWWFGSGQGVIDYGSGDVTQWQYEGSHVNVGDTVTFSGSGGRTYSIAANYAANLPGPATLALVTLGLLGVAARRRKLG